MVERVRSFNRAVAQRVGALDDRFLARARPMAEARLLWEIGPEGCEVRSLRARLGLDSGHASRLLRSLERDGLIRVAPSPADGRVRSREREGWIRGAPSPADGRVRRAELTPAGVAEREQLDRRSDDLAKS